MRSLRVNETKLTLRNAFISEHFALEGERNQHLTKGPFFKASYRNLNCLLTLSLGKTHVRVFPDYFSFRHLFRLLVLDMKSKIILGKTSQIFAAYMYQYSDYLRFFKILKHSARVKYSTFLEEQL